MLFITDKNQCQIEKDGQIIEQGFKKRKFELQFEVNTNDEPTPLMCVKLNKTLEKFSSNLN